MSKAKKKDNQNLTYQTEPEKFFKPAVSPPSNPKMRCANDCDDLASPRSDAEGGRGQS